MLSVDATRGLTARGLFLAPDSSPFENSGCEPLPGCVACESRNRNNNDYSFAFADKTDKTWTGEAEARPT